MKNFYLFLFSPILYLYDLAVDLWAYFRAEKQVPAGADEVLKKYDEKVLDIEDKHRLEIGKIEDFHSQAAAASKEKQSAEQKEIAAKQPSEITKQLSEEFGLKNGDDQ